MKYTFETYDNQQFILLTIEPVYQKGNVYYLAKIPANQLLDIYTVRPAEYDIYKNEDFANSFPDERSYYEHLVDQSKEKLGKKDFQRNYDSARVNKIAKYIDDKDYPFFPNAIIASCELVNSYEELNISEESSISEFLSNRGNLNHLSFLFEESGSKKLLIPYKERTVLIIDGQHRLEGLKRASSEIIDNYELVLSFIIGYNRSIIASQFYTINYEQKSVNKSLLYQLTGEFSTELTQLSFLHNVAKVLNEVKNSPFHRRIKMLGVNPINATQEEKDLLSISQAFLIDWLMKTVSPNSVGSLYQPIFLYQFKDKKKHSEIIKFIIKYFNAIKELKPDWNNPESSIISKGMGVGALIRVLHFLYVKLFFDEFESNPDFISEISSVELIKILDGIENVDFSKEGPFGRVGSAGSINRIKESLIKSIGYFECDNYDSFEANYRINYRDKFKKWLDAEVV